MARSVYYAAVSADGFIATRDGGVEWLEPFQSSELGYQAFLATVTAVVMGRATYDQSLTFGPWPYPGRRGLVVSRHPITGLPEGVTAVQPDELHAALGTLRQQTSGVLWIVGGGRAARACLDWGWIDELELYVVPRLLGDGIPLFERRDGLVRLRLLETRAYGNGIVMVRHAVETGTASGAGG
jgi:dihydrofolate reductase